jgi:hypothetical protein
MLYTLSLFACEPVRWVDKYEWRKLSQVEKCGLGVFWKAIGDAMQISWTGLPGYDSGRGWTDGLQWMDEISAWSAKYEARCMVPHETNARTAEQTTAILLWTVPQPFKHTGKQVVGALMDKRLRKAMMYETPPAVISQSVEAVLQLRGFLLRYFALPRPEFLRSHNVTDERSAQDTIFMKVYASLPYYVRPTIWNRWGPSAWLSWVMGLPLPGDDGDKYYPGGYRTVDVGPSHGKQGQKAMEATVGKLGNVRCPFAFGTSAPQK